MFESHASMTMSAPISCPAVHGQNMWQKYQIHHWQPQNSCAQNALGKKSPWAMTSSCTKCTGSSGTHYIWMEKSNTKHWRIRLQVNPNTALHLTVHVVSCVHCTVWTLLPSLFLISTKSWNVPVGTSSTTNFFSLEKVLGKKLVSPL